MKHPRVSTTGPVWFNAPPWPFDRSVYIFLMWHWDGNQRRYIEKAS